MSKNSLVSLRVLVLAHLGEFSEIARLRLTEEDLTTIGVDSHGRNILHIAAEHENLDRVPLKLFTARLSTAKTNQGETVLHLASQLNGIKHLPKRLLTPQCLSEWDSKGYSSLHYASKYNNLNQIPDDLLSESTLLLKNSNGSTVLETELLEAIKERISELMENSDTSYRWDILSASTAYKTKKFKTERLTYVDKLLERVRTNELLSIAGTNLKTNPTITSFIKIHLNARTLTTINKAKNKTLIVY